jgi:hypothetical protein
MEPITERRAVPGPVVYGYLRLATLSLARRAALTTALDSYCDRHELMLAGVFTDSGTGTTWTPGFTGLIHAVLASGNYGVVVPSLAHLGAGQAGAQRAAAITGTGRRLMLVHNTLACAMARRAR